MSRTSVRVMLFVLTALMVLFLMARLRYAGKAPVKLRAENCDPVLWKHVYKHERLRVIEECTSVEGRVTTLHRASDGDLHVGLDPEQKSVLNLVNVMHAGSELVVEVVCEHAPTERHAIPACAGFASQVTIPAVGDQVRVTGAYVTDRDNGWNEIHPASRIDILR